jgi:hypothetical protein
MMKKLKIVAGVTIIGGVIAGIVASYCFAGKCQSIGSGISISLVGSGQSHILPTGIEAGVEITLGLVWKVETAPKPIFGAS